MSEPDVDDLGPPEVKPFAAFVQEMRNGGLHGELSDTLQDLVASCIEHEKGGSLTLTLTLKPNKDGETLTITDQVKVKRPEAPRPPALFFADDRGNLSRHNPRQPELPIRAVPAPQSEPRDLRRAN